jgi:glycosyltransferase involved in cell wall biosynthesis
MRSFFLGCTLACRRKLRGIRPDIVHGQGTERFCAISAVFSGFKNVITIHGNMRILAKLSQAPRFSYPWLAARLEGFVVPRADGVVCITDYTRNAVRDTARKTWLLPNAIERRFFTETIRNPGSKVILCVGVICPRKNQVEFIHALDPIAERHGIQVLFLGKASEDVPYVSEFNKLLSERPWAKHGGLVSREELKTLLDSAGLLVLPSLEDNCPMVVLEAMASGVPVVAPNVGGVPDLVRDGQNGTLCNPQDRQSITAAVEKLLTHPDLATRLARTALIESEARFHPKVVASRHLEIYREVLGL